MEFLAINLKTKDSSLLLHAIQSLSTGGFLKKTRFYILWFSKHIQKNLRTRKFEFVRE
jgi:hypothetical protein